MKLLLPYFAAIIAMTSICHAEDTTSANKIKDKMTSVNVHFLSLLQNRTRFAVRFRSVHSPILI